MKNLIKAHELGHPNELPRLEDRTVVTLTCHACGKRFQREKRKIAPNQKTFYCSYQCFGTKTQAPLSMTCEQCGTAFERKPHKARKSKRHFCSMRCARDFFTGKEHPRWKGNRVTKEASRERAHSHFPSQCMVCGWAEASCDAHHIEPSKMGNHDPSNLIILCPNHHRMADKGLLAIDQLREIRARFNF